LSIIKVVLKGFKHSFPMLRNTYMGVLGWLDVRLHWFFIYMGYLSILLILLYENQTVKLKISPKQRVLLVSTGLLLTFLVYLSQYLSWAGVGSDYCGSIQGRYFITVFPLIFIGLIYKPVKQRLLMPLALGMLLIVLVGATFSMYKRYYAYPNETLNIVCDSESTWQDDYMGEIYFKTNIPDIMVFNGITQSNEKAHSGNYASKTTTQAPYGATFRLYNYALGDTLQAEVWYYGDGGMLWVTCSENNVFLAQSNIVETDAKGWKKIVHSFVVDEKLENAEIAVFVESKQLCYFDDFKISVRPK
jgi:hypothetical protein